MRTSSDWQSILLHCGIKPTTAQNWGNVFAKRVTNDTFDTPIEVATFLGQVLHESSMLECLEENLNYSAARLTQVWPSRFPTIEDAEPFAKSPIRLANKVYGGRMGNTEPSDGYKYRGRGLMMVTGKSNYLATGKSIGMDLIAQPELLAYPDTALKAAIAWWKNNIPASILDNIDAVTKKVNGGTIGIQHRSALTIKAKEVV